MSCRTTPAGRLLTSWGRQSQRQYLTDAAAQSVFHRLRHVHNHRDESRQRTYTVEQYNSMLDEVTSNITLAERREEITEEQANEHRERVTAAREAGLPEDPATVYAAMQYRSAMQNRARSVQQFIDQTARITGEPYEDLRVRFLEAARSVTTRTAPNHTREERTRVAGLGMPRDAGTVFAVQRLELDAAMFQIARARQAPQRVRLQEHTPDGVNPVVDGMTLTRTGYNAQVRRLEVELTNANGETSLFAYREVPEDVAARVMSGSADAVNVWASDVRGHDEFAYRTELEEALHGEAPRCDVCGQWRTDNHPCPVNPQRIRVDSDRYRRTGDNYESYTGTQYNTETGEIYELERVSVGFPPVNDLRTAIQDTGLELSIDYSRIGILQRNPGDLRGRLFVDQTSDLTGELVIHSELQCYCDEYNGAFQDLPEEQRNATRQPIVSCAHTRVFEAAFRQRVAGRTPEQIAAVAAEQDRAARAALAEIIQERRVRLAADDWYNNGDFGTELEANYRARVYTSEPEVFLRDMTAGWDHVSGDGAVAIPFETRDVFDFDGIGTRESGVGFGVEIEYDGDVDEWELGRALHAAGLTNSAEQMGYHAAERIGYRDTHVDGNGRGTWSFEEDGSVAGEIVTPIMYDEPETWERLATVCRILDDHGAAASLSAGAHIHIGMGPFMRNPAVHTELARMFSQHQDVIFRLNSNPTRGTHRRNGYAPPVGAVPAAGFASLAEVRRWQRGRSAINFANVTGTAEDHVEFRVPDSSLDPGTIQFQAKLALGMLHAAVVAADPERSGMPTSRGGEPLGSHLRRGMTAEFTPGGDNSDFLEQSGTFRSFVDTLFRRDVDRQQAATVWAATRWSALARED